jgi:tetratricopeptide (TPR) repeat protein
VPRSAFVAVNRTWRAAGYRSGAADAKGKLARVKAAQGRYDEALDLFASCIGEMDDIGSRANAFEATARMAECLLLSEASDDALALADRGLALTQDLGGVPSQIPLLHRVRGAALARLGQTDAAIEALHQSLQTARGRGAAHEVELTERVADDALLDLQPPPPLAVARSRS